MISTHYRLTRQFAPAAALAAVALATVGWAGDMGTGPASGAAEGVWYAIPAAFLLGVLAALIIYSRLQRRRRGSAPLNAAAAVAIPGAPTVSSHVYLLQQGGDGIRHEILHTPCRIGRGTERNEVVLKHPSISRRHAQITLRKDGLYEITDMESLNGVFVNDRKVKNAPLADGDIIDVGDLTFKFTTRGE
ncbi:MAG: FHA domain-containing protein [Gammaproteobacteria bacterium]|nr:FHA domain-containing protein [Gammaproteobacteria bacterium]MCG3146289.1 hypothetical protein [Gammaproteobacteria bacterium]